MANPYTDWLNQLEQLRIKGQTAAPVMTQIQPSTVRRGGGGISFPNTPGPTKAPDYAGAAQGAVEMAKLGQGIYDKYWAVDPALKAAQGASNVPAQMNAIKGAFGAAQGAQTAAGAAQGAQAAMAAGGAAPGMSVAGANAAANAAAGAGGAASGLGSGLAAAAGPAMGALGTGMSIYDIAKNGVGGKSLGNRAMGGATGALSGAALGSVVPGIGTAVGAVIGGILGLL